MKFVLKVSTILLVGCIAVVSSTDIAALVERRNQAVRECQTKLPNDTRVGAVLSLSDETLFEVSKPFFKCIYEKSEIFVDHAVNREIFMEFMMVYKDEGIANQIADACLMNIGSVDDDDTAFLLHKCSGEKLREYYKSTS